MTETEKEPNSTDPPKEPAPISKKPKIDLEELRNMMVIAKGGDPKAQQTINDFIKFDNNTERSNFPNSKTTLVIAQLNGYSQVFYPDDPNNPFALAAGSIEIAFMARKGWKSEGFVEMMKQTSNMPDLVTSSEAKQRGIGDRILGRGKE